MPANVYLGIEIIICIVRKLMHATVIEKDFPIIILFSHPDHIPVIVYLWIVIFIIISGELFDFGIYG